jgi:hypothetical protein
VKALIVISADPRLSPRAAEAVRIAAGISVWDELQVAVVLHGPATLALAEDGHGLVDGEKLAGWWRVLARSQCPVYAEKGSTHLPGPDAAVVRFEEVDAFQLAALSAESRCLMRF